MSERAGEGPDRIHALDAKLTRVWWSVWFLWFTVVVVGLAIALLLA